MEEAGAGGHIRGAGTGGHIRGAGTGGSDAPSLSSSPRGLISSPSAAVQGAELHSTACFLVMGTVAGSRTWSDGLGSTSGAIFRSVARLCAGSLIAEGNGSTSSVGSGWCSAPRGDGGLGSGSGVDLARSSSGETVRGRSISRQRPLHKGGEILSRTIFGRQRSACGVQACIVE